MPTRLTIKKDPETDIYQILIDGEEIDMPVTCVEVKVTSRMAEATFCVPIQDIDLDVEGAELNIKIKSPEDLDAD